MRIDVDPSLAFLGIGGILDATAHLLVGVIALLWLWRSRGGLSLDAGALAVA